MNSFDINNYIIHKHAIDTLTKWLNDFENGVPNTPETAIIYGPSGSGKTSLVNNILNHLSYDIIEFLPDHVKTHKYEIKRLKDMLNGNNIMMMVNNYKKAIFFDDIDISGERGFISDIMSLINNKKKKKTKNCNPLILTMNNKISNKKTAIIDKFSVVIHIDRIPNDELFLIGKNIINQLNKIHIISDNKLKEICKSCQGDIRNLNQKLKGIDNSNKESLINHVYGLKDLEIKCLPTLEKYIHPNTEVKYTDFSKLYYNDPLFIPAFIYENSYQIINRIQFKNKKESIKYTYKILDSLCNWCLFDHNFSNTYTNYHFDYNIYNGLIIPVYYIKNYRKQYNWNTYSLKTSNLYSRISQSSFNNRSICELSNQLNISKNEYHLFTYILYQLFLSKNTDIHNELVQYLESKNIISSDIDRLFRYNCLSSDIDVLLTNKKKSYIRKLLNSIKIS